MMTAGDIAAVIEMAHLESSEQAEKDSNPEAFRRGVDIMREQVRTIFEETSEMKLPKVQAVRKGAPK